MTRVGMRALAALLFAALVAGLPAVPAGAASSHPPGVDYVYDATNDYRTLSGAKALAFDTNLQAVAQAWAEKMAADYAGGMTVEQAFRHNPTMTAQIPAGWQRAGENIALNGGYTGQFAKLMDQWKTSPQHNTNMLNPNWTSIGVGVYTDATGITWGVQVFAQYTPTWVAPVITLAAPAPAVVGTAVTIRVSVDSDAAATGRIWARTPGGSWAMTSKSFAVANGVGSTTIVAPSQPQDYKVQMLGTFSNAVSFVPVIPVVTLSGPSSVVWGTTKTYSVAVAPTISGVASLQYSRPGGAWLTSTKTVTVTKGVGSFTLTPVDPKVTYRVVIAGSTSNAIAVSAVAPVVTLSGPSSVVWGTTKTYSVSVSAPVTGVASLQYARPGDAWTTSAKTVTVTNGVGSFTLTPVDPKVTYRVVIAGATSNAIAVAAVAPVVTLSGPSSVVWGTTKTYSVSVSSPVTGVASLQYARPGDAWTTSAKTVTVTNGVGSFTLTPVDPKVTYRVVIAGATSNAIAVAAVAPVVTLSGPSSVVWGTTKTYSVSVSSPVTGVASLQYARPGDAWTTSAKTVAVTKGVGSFTLTPVDPKVTYRVVIAGSTSNAIPVTAVAPVVTLTGPSSVVWGTTKTYSVSVSSPVTGVASLQYARPGGAWTTSAKTVTVTKGVGSFTLTPVDPKVTYRVVIAGSTSNAIPVTAVAPVVTLSGPSSVVWGTTKTYSVSVTPAVSGVASLQYSRPGGAWTTSTKTVTVTNGAGTFTLTPVDPMVTYRVAIAGSTSNSIPVAATR